jgi:hypothetical protein
MGQTVSRWPLTTKARLRSRVSPCGICGGQSGTGTGFSPDYFGLPLSMSFHQCSMTRKNEKTNLHHRAAQQASRLRCVRSISCWALYHKKMYMVYINRAINWNTFYLCICALQCSASLRAVKYLAQERSLHWPSLSSAKSTAPTHISVKPTNNPADTSFRTCFQTACNHLPDFTVSQSRNFTAMKTSDLTRCTVCCLLPSHLFPETQRGLWT